MAQLAGTYDTADAKGLRESLSDIIFDISPTDTPIVSGARKGKAKAIREEWQTDTLAAAAHSPVVEGNDAAFSDPAATTRPHNVCEILQKTLLVTDTMEAVDKAGRSSEIEYQIGKRGAEIKRDLEVGCLANNAIVNRAAATAGVMAGLPAWIATNAPTGSATAIARNVTGGGAPGGWNGTTVVVATDGTTRAFTQAILDYCIQKGYESGAKIEGMKLLMGPKQRTVFSGFDGIASQIQTNAAAKVIQGRADVYASNFGDLMVMNERFIRQTASADREVFGIDFEYLELAVLRDFRVTDLAKTGDATKKLLVWEGTLKVLNEAALIQAADLS
jgi:hypothetical protein